MATDSICVEKSRRRLACLPRRSCTIEVQRRCVFFFVLLATLLQAGEAAGPRGVVTALATQSRTYTSQVTVAYVEPVNCTLEFDGDVQNLGPLSINTGSSTTRIINFVEVRATKYTFQVVSDVNANVTIYLPANAVRDSSGLFNDQITGYFNFEFYAAPPSVTLQLEGYEGTQTNRLENVGYLVFNSTTIYDGTSFFDSSMISLEPAYTMSNWQMVNDKVFKFNFKIELNESNISSIVRCVESPTPPPTPMPPTVAPTLEPTAPPTIPVFTGPRPTVTMIFVVTGVDYTSLIADSMAASFEAAVKNSIASQMSVSASSISVVLSAGYFGWVSVKVEATITVASPAAVTRIQNAAVQLGDSLATSLQTEVAAVPKISSVSTGQLAVSDVAITTSVPGNSSNSSNASNASNASNTSNNGASSGRRLQSGGNSSKNTSNASNASTTNTSAPTPSPTPEPTSPTPEPTKEWIDYPGPKVEYPCSLCPRSQHCESTTTYPPAGVSYLEFPLQMKVAPVPGLLLSAQNLSIVYDTLWAEVSMDAPAYAKEAFFVTVTWTEPLADMTAIVPSFGLTGPTVDVDLMNQNLTRISPNQIRLLIVPSNTGVLQMLINGTQFSKDLAGNNNDFRRNPLSRTGDGLNVVYSAGPPLEGTIGFTYDRASATYEYNVLPSAVGAALVAPPPSLSLNWDGFTTATRYDLWIRWGQNLSTQVLTSLTVQSFRWPEFRALLGVEYTAYIRAWNYWGQATVLSKTFVHPQIDIVADGTYSIVRLPDLLSQTQTNVSLHLLVPDQGFMSLDPLKVLSVRSANRALGDQDPCQANSRLLECTFMTFHIEVPDTKFVVFKKPMRLQFVFGQQGWSDNYFRPSLHYWESYGEEWRSVTSTCPPEQIYDLWNEKLRVYEVSLCHLSLFTVFAKFAPPAAAEAVPEPPRPTSYNDPALFIVLGALAVASILVCCVFYWACIHTPQTSPEKNAVNFDELGIKSVSQRLPSRREPNLRSRNRLAVQPWPDEARKLMPPPNSSSEPVGRAALEDEPKDTLALMEKEAEEDEGAAEHEDTVLVPVPAKEADAEEPKPLPPVWSTQDEVREDEFQSYASTLSKSLARNHETVQQVIEEFLMKHFDELQESGSATSAFEPFEVQSGKKAERITVDIKVEKSAGAFLVSYKSRATSPVPSASMRLPNQASSGSEDEE